jgi:uncharacterized damage-inducible protein DinB
MRAQGVRELLLKECVTHLEEGRQRIHHCVALLTDEQTWHRPNEHTVSAGNLVLHLCGNVRQWIISTLGGDSDSRDRDNEFNTTGPVDRAQLLGDLDATIARALEVIASLDEEQLLRTYRVQGYTPTGVGIVVHVTEHFSYHVGQITLHTKLLRNVDTGYYSGVDLNTKG